MQTDSRLPVYAHWQGLEFVVDLPNTQPDPDVGSIIHLTVDVNGELQRHPFKVKSKRQRTDAGTDHSLLSRIGLGGDALPIAIDLEVEPHRPGH